MRVIAATNRDLEEAVRAGRFRSDLFYRLNVFPIQVPPLRERRADIPLLVMFFLSRFARKLGKKIEAVPQGIMDLLTAYDWPGNIRELQNLIERAVVLSQGPLLRLDRALVPAVALDAVTAPPEIVRDDPAKPGRDRAGRIPSATTVPGEALALEEVERRHIVGVLKQTQGVIEGPKGCQNPTCIQHLAKSDQATWDHIPTTKYRSSPRHIQSSHHLFPALRIAVPVGQLPTFPQLETPVFLIDIRPAAPAATGMRVALAYVKTLHIASLPQCLANIPVGVAVEIGSEGSTVLRISLLEALDQAVTIRLRDRFGSLGGMNCASV
jgi:hypothetical protein